MPKGMLIAGYSENYIVWQNILNGSDIAAGKGRITVEDDLSQTLQGKILVLDILYKKGPCTDDMCQLIKGITARILPEPQNPSDNVMHKQGFSLAMDPDIFRSIDKGREHLTVRKRRASVTVKGFAFTS